jgi:tryptophan synthase beta chain
MPRKFMLEEKEIPTHYYNIAADLPTPLDPPLHPGTKQPIGPQDLAPLFPMELIKQEVSAERFIEIPDAVRNAYERFVHRRSSEPLTWNELSEPLHRSIINMKV